MPRSPAASIICLFLGLLLLVLPPANRGFFLWANCASSHAPAWLWLNLTALGNTLLILALLFPWLCRNRKLAGAAIIAAVASTALVHGLKGPLAMPRPAKAMPSACIHVLGSPLKKNSFPSGHASAAFTGAGLAALGIRQGYFRLAALALAFLIAFSRLAVGAHWPSDVLFGGGAGWLSAWLGMRLAPWMSWLSSSLAQKIFLGGIALALLFLLLGEAAPEAAPWFKRGIALVSLAWGLPALLPLFGYRLALLPEKGR